jgi:hypothetical protein
MKFYNEDGDEVSVDDIMSHPEVEKIKSKNTEYESEIKTQRELIKQKSKSIDDLKNSGSDHEKREAELKTKAEELSVKEFELAVSSKITGDAEYVSAIKDKLKMLGTNSSDADFEQKIKYAESMVKTDGIPQVKEAKPATETAPAPAGGQPPRYFPEVNTAENYKSTDEDKAFYKSLKESGLMNN